MYYFANESTLSYLTNHICKILSIDYSIVPHLMPNKPTNRKQRSCFIYKGQCIDYDIVYAYDISIHNWSRNDIEQKNINILCHVFQS